MATTHATTANPQATIEEVALTSWLEGRRSAMRDCRALIVCEPGVVLGAAVDDELTARIPELVQRMTASWSRSAETAPAGSATSRHFIEADEVGMLSINGIDPHRERVLVSAFQKSTTAGRVLPLTRSIAADVLARER